MLLLTFSWKNSFFFSIEWTNSIKNKLICVRSHTQDSRCKNIETEKLISLFYRNRVLKIDAYFPLEKLYILWWNCISTHKHKRIELKLTFYLGSKGQTFLYFGLTKLIKSEDATTFLPSKGKEPNEADQGVKKEVILQYFVDFLIRIWLLYYEFWVLGLT